MMPQARQLHGHCTSTHVANALVRPMSDLHEYLVHQVLVSLTVCNTLNALSRSYIYKINPIVCQLLVHTNITLRHATASLLEQAAASLSVAQHHCFVLPYVNPLIRIRLFTITVKHVNTSLLSPVLRNSCSAFERCDFPPKTSVDDIVAQLENTGVTNPDKCLTKLVPYLFNVRERSARAATAATFTLSASNELNVRLFPLRGLLANGAQRAHIPLNFPMQPCSNDNPRWFVQAPAPPPPKPLNNPKLLYEMGDARLQRPDRIDGFCVAHLVEHCAAVTALVLGGICIFFVLGDTDGCLRVLETGGTEALSVTLTNAEHRRAAGVAALWTNARSTVVVVEYQDGVVELLRDDTEGNANADVGFTVLATIELWERVVAVQAEPKAITIASESGILAILDARDGSYVVTKENDVRLWYLTAMTVAQKGQYCAVGTNRGFVCCDLRHRIANIGLCVPLHAVVTVIVFQNEDVLETDTNKGGVFCWFIHNENAKTLSTSMCSASASYRWNRTRATASSGAARKRLQHQRRVHRGHRAQRSLCTREQRGN